MRMLSAAWFGVWMLVSGPLAAATVDELHMDGRELEGNGEQGMVPRVT